ncbi:MAG: hypothetical protein ACPGJS_01395 [Flammeovirgaceae bacterium]
MMRNYLLIICAIYCLSACSADQKLVNIAVSKQGKVYLYSLMGQSGVEQQLAIGETPTVMKAHLVLPDGDAVWMEASKLDVVANILGGNYTLIDKKEKSYDGYVVLGQHQLVAQKYQNEDSGEIGKLIGKMNVTLSNQENANQHEIVWQLTPELKALQNCEKRSLTVQSTVPGEDHTYYLKDHVLVNLKDVVNFYGIDAEVIYNEGAELLYIYLNE